MNKPKILVVGDVMLDRYVHGTVDRISPEAPVPILREVRTEDRPGGAANVAANLASLGADVLLVGAIGADKEGDLLSSLCAAMVGRYLTLNTVAGRTAIKKRFVCSGQQMLRVDQDGGRPTERALGDILQAVRGKLPGAAALVLSDYAGGVLDDPQPMIERARRLGVPVYVDPKGTDWERYRGATLIKPNEAELLAMVGNCYGAHNEMLCRGANMLRELGIEQMLVTHGAGGMTWVNQVGDYLHQDATSGPVVDVTGAGDTVLAVVAYMRAIDWDWPGTLNLAAKAAAAVCARHGTSVVTQADLGQPKATYDYGPIGAKVTSESLA